MSLITGQRELLELAGLDPDDVNNRRKLVEMLRRNKVPYIGIGSTRAGNVRGILVHQDALATMMEHRMKTKQAKRDAAATAAAS